jgi:adenylate kinase
VLRRTDKRTGQIYHLKYSPPPPEADLEHRADDREDVVKKRLDTYEAMTAELLPYYEERGILRRVDGVGSVKEVTGRVFAALGADV